MAGPAVTKSDKLAGQRFQHNIHRGMCKPSIQAKGDKAKQNQHERMRLCMVQLLFVNLLNFIFVLGWPARRMIRTLCLDPNAAAIGKQAILLAHATAQINKVRKDRQIAEDLIKTQRIMPAVRPARPIPHRQTPARLIFAEGPYTDQDTAF